MSITQRLALWSGVITILLSCLVALRAVNGNLQTWDRAVDFLLISIIYVVPAVSITFGHYLTLRGKRRWGSVLLSIGVVFYSFSLFSFIGGLAYLVGWLGLAPIVGATLTLCLILAKELKSAFWIGPPEE
jgi:hypothetical protein